MEINIKIVSSKAIPPKGKSTKPSLKERVEYALDCLECGHQKKEAITFLQAAHAKLDGSSRRTKEDAVLLERVSAAISDFGHYHIEDDK